MNKIIKITILCITSVILTAVIFRINFVKNENNTTDSVIKTGMTKGQKDYFSSKLSEAVNINKRFDMGEKLRNQSKYEEAVSLFKEIFNDIKHPGYKGMAIIQIANTFEKEKDYKNALKYMVISRDEYVNEWAKEPIIERVKYLEYALQGNYELAIEHAKLALEAEMKVHDSKKPRRDYLERFNDLKASKEYIEGLKK